MTDFTNSRARQVHYFQIMPPDEQVQAIQRLANSGMPHATIAAATGLSVEMVRRLLASTDAVTQ